ncbi:MAG TPA: hypothetical protein VGP13_04120 [Candidatus Paceibacterota bacterium]|jgi:hypothetical protein|nr:hypothetical protein [Candidatus Paceibacterota bacterium]
MKSYLKWAAVAVVLLLALVGAAFVVVFVAMQFGLLNVRGSIADRNAFFTGSATTTIPAQPCTDDGVQVCAWDQTPEWSVVKGGLQKDASIIARVSQETGVSGRMIATVVVPEQTRFFTSNREVFKRYFEPLKILGSLSQFSLGVSGIKEETANNIEMYANDPASPFYPGPQIEKLLAYNATSTLDHNTALFNRLTDAKDHYYSLLYTAAYIKEIESQWSRAGFDISKSPEAIATLFNVGFAASNPNANPKSAGAPITTGGNTYVYGTLGALFYNSDELSDIFSK